ncbi:uncharacterized protein F5891DRAFT_581537 [Suillus fuscotomentosus]|uniref:Cytochrome P450 n=1 Tax=Suillus fuscotomentosus TaxID=1912939 RepID=A0AAD4DYX3_9AGAM|nr:uncharacterized protein F5891DRAFT_581537 [Suillus fuscotomentosus]KAG1896664.1 hypothetical protein F5891DRAFT_581537 [Suillus fuscotomentosus]
MVTLLCSPAFLFLLSLSRHLRRFIKKRQHSPSLPPGLVPLPLLENVLPVDSQEPWLTYTEWSAAYGIWSSSLIGQVFYSAHSSHMAFRSTLDSAVMAMNGAFADDSSTQRSVPSLQ